MLALQDRFAIEIPDHEIQEMFGVQKRAFDLKKKNLPSSGSSSRAKEKPTVGLVIELVAAKLQEISASLKLNRSRESRNPHPHQR